MNLSEGWQIASGDITFVVVLGPPTFTSLSSVQYRNETSRYDWAS